MPIHRHIKNVVHNYTDAERKVREATSNDPWGPSSTLMAEIADKTHNVMAFTEIMQMIWRRLNDKSKNWRHVYKSLVLLEYLMKTGSDKVATQCRENIHSIDTLKDFQYNEDGKDRGQNVREKARVLSTLLRDEDRLHEERTKALLARDRLLYSGFGTTTSAGGSPNRYPFGFSGSGYLEKTASPIPSKSPVPHASTELDSVRPQSVEDEQLHLQLALALSKEEHEREERRRRAEEAKEEAKVKMVLEQSRREEQRSKPGKQPSSSTTTNNNSFDSSTNVSSGGLFSLVDTSLSAAPAHLPDPWSSPLTATTSNNSPLPNNPTCSIIPIDDPWSPNPNPQVATHAQSMNASISTEPIWNLECGLAPVSSTSNTTNNNGIISGFDNNTPFDMEFGTNHNSSASHQIDGKSTNGTVDSKPREQETQSQEQSTRKRTPADFLGEHQNLVDLEKLVEKNPASTNPFTIGPRSVTGIPVNPFLANQPIKPSLNQLAPTLAITGPTDTQTNPMFYPIRPFYPTLQSTYSMPIHSNNAWSTESTGTNILSQQPQPPPQQQTSLNPFY